MKPFFLYISFFLTSLLSFGQTSFKASISLGYMNVIYTTIDNPITVTTNSPASDIQCSINKNGIIEKGHFDNYSVRVIEEGNYQLKITQVSTGASVSYSLRAKSLPIPFANLDNVFGDSISSQKLISLKQLDLSYVPSFDVNISAEVISFSLLRISNKNTRSESDNVGSAFTNNTKDIVNACNSGDILIFKNIIAKGVDPDTLKIPDLVLYVQ